VEFFSSFFLLLLFCANQKKIHAKRSASDAVGSLPRSPSEALRNLKGSKQLMDFPIDQSHTATVSEAFFSQNISNTAFMTQDCRQVLAMS
jgi:hypothetical protein